MQSDNFPSFRSGEGSSSGAPVVNLAASADLLQPSAMQAGRSANPADAFSVLMAAFAAAAIGALMYNVLPLYLGSMEVSKTLPSSRTGLIGTAFFFGFNIAGISAFAWIRRFHWRTVALLSMPLLFLTLFGSDYITAFPMLLTVTVVCGIAFGITYTIGSVIIGDTSRPERWYGVKVGLETVVGAVILFVLPLTPVGQLGFTGTVWGMAICIAALLPLLFFLPAVWDKDPLAASDSSEVAGDRPKINLSAIACAVAALLTLFASVSAIWAFAERMGRLSGFDEASVGALLAITIVTGIAGSAVVAVIGNRINAVVAYVGSALLIIVSLICLTIKGSFPLYAFGNCLYMFAWAAGTPLAMAEIARLDRDGRYISLVAPAIGVGGMIGPGVAGWLLEISSPSAVLIYVATMIVTSAALMIAASRLAHQTQAPA